MKAADIWNAICELACSQGLYGRLKEALIESGRKEEILKEWEAMGFKDRIDLIMFIEC